MSAGCCGTETTRVFDGTSQAFRRALWIVIALNAMMFGVEMLAGLVASSQALKADALDFLGDTATYSLTLLVIGRPIMVRTRAALIKGWSLLLMGLWVLGSTFYQVFILGMPRYEVMGVIAILALAANITSVLLLIRFRNGDANVRSVWLCSRNDAVANIAVVIAALGVWGSGTPWPDLLVAGVMAALFSWSSLQIIRQALAERSASSAYAAGSPTGAGSHAVG